MASKKELKEKMEKSHWVIMEYINWRMVVSALEECLLNMRADDKDRMRRKMRIYFIDIRDYIKNQVGIDE